MIVPKPPPVVLPKLPASKKAVQACGNPRKKIALPSESEGSSTDTFEDSSFEEFDDTETSSTESSESEVDVLPKKPPIIRKKPVTAVPLPTRSSAQPNLFAFTNRFGRSFDLSRSAAWTTKRKHIEEMLSINEVVLIVLSKAAIKATYFDAAHDRLATDLQLGGKISILNTPDLFCAFDTKFSTATLTKSIKDIKAKMSRASKASNIANIDKCIKESNDLVRFREAAKKVSESKHAKKSEKNETTKLDKKRKTNTPIATRQAKKKKTDITKRSSENPVNETKPVANSRYRTLTLEPS